MLTKEDEGRGISDVRNGDDGEVDALSVNVREEGNVTDDGQAV